MKYLNILILLIIVVGCNHYNEQEKRTFDYVERKIDEGCTLFIMFFYKSNYMYRVGTKDSCKNLTQDGYVDNYNRLLKDSINKIVLKRGKILVETDFNLTKDSAFIKKIISITETAFNAKGRIIEVDIDRLTIELE